MAVAFGAEAGLLLLPDPVSGADSDLPTSAA